MIKFRLKYTNIKRSSVKMEVNFMSKRYYFPTGVAVEVKEWNPKTNRLRQTMSNADEAAIVNQTLDKLEVAGKRTMAKFVTYRDAPSADEFRKAFDLEYKGKPKPKETRIMGFTTYMDVYIERYRATKTHNTTKSIVTVKNKLKEFEKHRRKKITFKGIDMVFHAELLAYFAEQRLRDSYFATTIKIVKQVFREAKNVDKLHNYDGIDAKGFKATSSEVDSIYLTEEELRRIYDLDLTIELLMAAHPEARESDMLRKLDSLKVSRALFLIGSYSGLRVSDLLRVGSMNIVDKIRIRTRKTDKEVVIPLHPIVKEMIEDSEVLATPIPEQKYNKRIKELAQLAGITERVEITRRIGGRRITEYKERWELVTTHTARRSFATNAYKASVPTLAIMKITGHTKESTFLKYIKIGNEENAEALGLHPFFLG